LLALSKILKYNHGGFVTPGKGRSRTAGGQRLDAPPSRDFRTTKKAPRARKSGKDKQHEMFGGEEE